VLRSAITGLILDRQTRAPLPGAVVIVLHSDPLIGVAADSTGRFHLRNIPIGTHTLQVSYMGYNTTMTDPVIVTSGKEAFITIPLDEAVHEIPEVEILAGYRKSESLNRMATVSVRSFSVDETFRIPGTYNDPARMVASFAGVTSGIDNRNDIIVRGNSPTGLQWRIDDMEIPNPNHFAATGTTGGPVTLLNNNLVTNSDFFTGAFPAQYGNTLAGVFDMKLRTGNIEKHEYWFGIGWNGIEFGTEGPFSRKFPASYLLSYRYSPLQFLDLLGINTGIVPRYQDINLKIVLPTRHAGTFTLTAIGGISDIELFDSRKEESEWLFPGYGENIANGSDLGVAGLSHQFFIGKNFSWKNILYVVASDTRTKIDTFSSAVTTPAPWAGEHSNEIRYAFSSAIMWKTSASNTLSMGLNTDYFTMFFADSVMVKGAFQVNTNSHEHMGMLRAYGQWQHFFSGKFSTTAGLFGSWLTLNNSGALEPRLGFTWTPTARHSLSLGTGMYSQAQPHVIYFIRDIDSEGNTVQPNLTLDYTRNAQIALGYQFLASQNLRFKTELYYQYLYDVPVKGSIPPYALINQGHEFFIDRGYADSLVNMGTGENLGAELTFERFLDRNVYYLFTASLFSSTYRGSDGTRRNTAFNVNYALNAAGGYEFVMGKRKWGVMSFGLRATWTGGNPYVPYDPEATVAEAEPVYNWNDAYNPRYPDYRRFSFRFGIRRNLPGYNLEFFIDLQYRTSLTNISPQRINPQTGEIREYFDLGFFPMGNWRIQF
jgi:hypothetical protein